MIGIFAMAVDASAANFTLPGVQADLDASTAGLQWVIASYMAAVGASVIAVSRAGDILGRRRVFCLGLIVFGLGSLACGLAPDVSVLIISRIVQGLGGGAVYSLSLAVITSARPPSEIGRGVAAWAVSAGLAMSIAPLAGGALVSAFDWRAVYLVNVPVVVVSIALTVALLPESRDEDASHHIDVRGAVALTAGVGLMMIGIIQAGQWGWDAPAAIAAIVGGLAVIALFVALERRAPDPLIDLRLFFGNLRFVAANALAVPAYGAIYVVLFLAPLFLQNIQGDSAAAAGVRLLPFPVVFFALSRPVGRMVGRTGALAPMMIGSALMVAATLMMSFVQADSGEALLGAGFAVLGAGQAFALIGISAAALGSLPPGKAGAASGIRSTFSYVGGALWIALAGAVLTALERADLADATDELGRRLTTGELRDVEGILSGSDSAQQAAAALPPLDAEAVRAAAADAFVYGMSWALRLCAIALAAVAVVAAILYRRAAAGDAAPSPPPEGSPLHPHPPAWATLHHRSATKESA